MSSNQGTGNINYSFDISNIYNTINGNKTFLFNYYLSIFISLIYLYTIRVKRYIYDEFKDYIESPIEYGPFDIILIDGRARVSCSSICKLLSHENTIIFIHDFHRPEYQEALKYLELIDSVKTMSKFKLKK